MDLFLPFITHSQDRVKRFSDNMEKATIFCLTENKRNKGGRVRKRSPEEIVCIAKVYYPIWTVPWGEITLLLDGLGLRKHTLPFDVLPDLKVFLREMKANTGKTETYVDFLIHNTNYFHGFAGQGRKVINGLITDPLLLEDFKKCFSKARYKKGSLSDKVILSEFMSKEDIRTSLISLSELKTDLGKDLRKLTYIVNLTLRNTDKHTKLAFKKIDRARQEADRKIAEFKTQAFRKTERVRRRYDKKILKIQDRTKQNLKMTQKQLAKIEVRKSQLLEYIKNCEIEILKCEEKNNETSLGVWKNELQKSRQEISEINNHLLEIEKCSKEIEQSGAVDIAQLEASYEAENKAIMTNLKKIENQCNIKIAFNNESVRSLEEATSSFIKNTNKLAEGRKTAISDLEKLGIKKRKRYSNLVYLPFYLVCYSQELKRRYSLVPPSLACGMRGVRKIKGVLKGSNIPLIFDERSESITKFLHLFLKLIKQNPIFEENLIKAGCKVNILGSEKSRQQVTKGIMQLKEEGWLTENQVQSFINQLK